MQFTYTYLENAYHNGIRIGSWKGSSVFAVPKRKLDSVDDGSCFLVVYDDNNALVKGGRKYGRVTESGDVRELDYPVDYDFWKKEAPKKTKEKKKEEVKAEVKEYKSSIPEVATGEIEIDNYIKRMRELTIDDMLADLKI